MIGDSATEVIFVVEVFIYGVTFGYRVGEYNETGAGVNLTIVEITVGLLNEFIIFPPSRTVIVCWNG